MRETEDRLCQTVRDCFAYILIMIPLNKLMILTRFNLRDSTRDGKIREYEVPSVGSYECYELVLRIMLETEHDHEETFSRATMI